MSELVCRNSIAHATGSAVCAPSFTSGKDGRAQRLVQPLGAVLRAERQRSLKRRFDHGLAPGNEIR
jgi:hypothetical protein